ncbi:hypothetical protein [Zavarzinia aquatilis]|uniref:Uncharacterized protein n=1 Tax=Zavarzinia aquatilis TaxID=2211142 RepID=A0A317E8F0_9PROT|nr:hypothetical protein [Zavarzinia aquatilis]PWR22540.1 hypothetical protein DKG74_11745 [Zavarzinia aquatilis]
MAEDHPRHSSRSGILEPTRHWSLTGDDLVMTEGSDGARPATRRAIGFALRLLAPFLHQRLLDRWPATVRFRDIRAIRLRFDPTRVDPDRWSCALDGPARTRVVIFSTSYKGLADFEDRGPAFWRFVRALTDRVTQANPAVRLATGLSRLAFAVQMGVAGAAVVLLCALYFMLGGPTGVSGALSLGAIGAVLVLLLRYGWANRPRPGIDEASQERLDRARMEEF